MALVYNTKASYYHKINNDEQALIYLDQALELEKIGDVDPIDVARTLLNKSVIMGQLARNPISKQQYPNASKAISQKNIQTEPTDIYQGQITNKKQSKYRLSDKQPLNLYSHETAIQLAKQALQIIKDRGTSRSFVQQGEYKLGQIIIISFHNIATQLVCLKNQKQAHTLYRKAYDLAIKVLGPRHSLTRHLKDIVSTIKSNKSRARVVTDMYQKQRGQNFEHGEQVHYSTHNSHQNYSKNKFNATEKIDSQKKINRKAQNYLNSDHNQQTKKRYKSFFKIYGYEQDQKNQHMKSSSHKRYPDNSISDMKDLKKIQKLYGDKTKSLGKSSNFPVLRKSINKVIKQGRKFGQNKLEYQPTKNQIIHQNIKTPHKDEISRKNLKDIIKTENNQITVTIQSNKQKQCKQQTNINKKQEQENKDNCQLI